MRKLNIKLIGLCTALTLLTVSTCVSAANYIGRSTEESEKGLKLSVLSIMTAKHSIRTELSQTAGKMYDGLRLKQKNIADPFN